jgi:hypothetical protein
MSSRWWRGWDDVKWINRFGDEPEALTEAAHTFRAETSARMANPPNNRIQWRPRAEFLKYSRVLGAAR